MTILSFSIHLDGTIYEECREHHGGILARRRYEMVLEKSLNVMVGFLYEPCIYFNQI